MDAEITHRIQTAQAKMRHLIPIWKNHSLSRKQKSRLFEACIVPRLTYGCATWALQIQQFRTLNRAYMRMIRHALGIPWKKWKTEQNEGPTNIRTLSYEEILTISGLDAIQIKIDSRVLQLAGHVARMEPDRMPIKTLFDQKRNGNKCAYGKMLRQSLLRVGINEAEWKRTAQDKAKWNQRITEYKDDSKLKKRPKKLYRNNKG